MRFTMEEMCVLTNQHADKVAEICGTGGDTTVPFTILSYYYVYLISDLIQWCTIGALKKSIPFEWMAPMVERANEEEASIQQPHLPTPMVPTNVPHQIYPAAGPVYAAWTPTVMSATKHTKVIVEIYWRQLIRDARETLLEWLLAERMKGGDT